MSRAMFPLADRALNGQLRARLEACRAAGRSYDDIAREFHADGIAVSGETVRKWCSELGIEKPSVTEGAAS